MPPLEQLFQDLIQLRQNKPDAGAPADVPIRREEGIGLPTLGALGLIAGGVLAARNPAFRGMLERTWQKPLGFAERWTGAAGATRPVELPHIGIPGMPSEVPIMRKVPQSTLVSETERVGTETSRKIKELTESPMWEQIKGQKPSDIIDVEHSRMADFLSRAASGMTQSQAKQASLAQAPQWFQEANAFRASMFPWEQQAKRFMGMERTAEHPGPYWARQAVRDEAASLRGKGGMFGEMRTSLGAAEEARTFPTQKAGMQAGVQYEDPRVSWLNREVNGIRLVETAKYMQRLENRVIFREKAAAQQVAGSEHVYELQAFPGAPTWYVPFKEEWKFLLDNLKDPEWGKLGFLRSWSNSLARNPNLINPLPHIVKNMAYKYRLAGGKLSQLPSDYAEFRRGQSPMVAMFKQVMPFDEGGQTGADIYQRAIRGVRSENYPAVVRLADLAMDATLGKAQRFSSKTIFATADPAMRYSLWKQYVQKGMSAAEAAQNVWVDLIRYGTRSTIVDAWKSVPLNFFVPWRVGTVTSLYKQLTTHPLRAAAMIGAVDLLREIRYRKSGQWTHLPIDYIEQPIAQVLQSKDPADAAKSLIAATLATLAFGPGGGFAASTIKDAMDDIQMRGDKSRLRNVFWGLSQMYEIPTHGYRVLQAMQSGNTALAASEAAKMLGSVAMAEHTALNYRPRRLLAALPEVGPWLQKSVQVKLAEQMQQAAERGGERAQARRAQRRRPIEERVRNVTEGSR